MARPVQNRPCRPVRVFQTVGRAVRIQTSACSQRRELHIPSRVGFGRARSDPPREVAIGRAFPYSTPERRAHARAGIPPLEIALMAEHIAGRVWMRNLSGPGHLPMKIRTNEGSASLVSSVKQCCLPAFRVWQPIGEVFNCGSTTTDGAKLQYSRGKRPL